MQIKITLRGRGNELKINLDWECLGNLDIWNDEACLGVSNGAQLSSWCSEQES